MNQRSTSLWFTFGGIHSYNQSNSRNVTSDVCLLRSERIFLETNKLKDHKQKHNKDHEDAVYICHQKCYQNSTSAFKNL